MLETLQQLAALYALAGGISALHWLLLHPLEQSTPRVTARMVVIALAGFLPWIPAILCFLSDTAHAMPLEWRLQHKRKTIQESLAEFQQLSKGAYDGVDADEYINAIRGR